MFRNSYKLFFISIFLLSLLCLNNNLFSSGGSFPFDDPFIPIMTSGAPIPVGLRYPAAAGYAKNDSAWVYIMGGLLDGNIISANCYRYNVKTDSWETIPPLPSGPLWIGSGICLGNKIYHIGGTNQLYLNAAQTTVSVYSTQTNTWSSAAPLIWGRVFMGVTAYQDSLIYVAGGWGYPGWTANADVFLYNTHSDQWRYCSSMNAWRCGGVLGVAGDTLVYVCGGQDWTNPSALNIVYRGVISQTNRANITWDTTGAVYPPGPRNSIQGAKWGNEIIVSGGYSMSGGNYANECYVYSPGANQWYQMPNLLTARTDHGAASVRMGSVWKYVNVTGTNNRSGPSLTSVNILTDTLTVVAVHEGSNTLPKKFTLYQNYPNPFNPSTKIKFDTPPRPSPKEREQDVRLIIYDILGREVATLVNEKLSPGTYEVTWDASNFVSGIYFYTLKTDNYSETKKLILLK